MFPPFRYICNITRGDVQIFFVFDPDLSFSLESNDDFFIFFRTVLFSGFTCQNGDHAGIKSKLFIFAAK